MRRHTMKQPSGPVVSASPTPATMARVKKSSSTGRAPFVVMVVMVMMMAIIGMAVIGHGTICVQHAPVRQMRVIVVMLVDGERPDGPAAEQPHIFGACRHVARGAAATDMAIEADDAVGRRHDQMQVVRNQKHA